MTDACVIRDIELWVRLGIEAEEHSTPQRVLATVEFPLDAARVAAADDLRDAVDYAALTKTVRDAASEEFRTVEAFIEHIAQTILQHHPLHEVRVSVAKFPLPGVRDVTITVHRTAA
jgi:7,8-dihydroneopterin aldolase/epimerase/oxygenase